MSKGSRLSSSQGVTRRGFTAGALGTGLILGSGRAPAIAQGKRDLRVGVWGGEFGNLSPVIRYDIQGGLVALQHLRRPGEDRLRQAHHRADAGARMGQSRSADLAHQAARGREVAEGLRRVHRRGRRLLLELPPRIQELPGRHGAVPGRQRQGRRQVRRRGQDQAAVRRLPRRHHGLWRHHHLGQGAQGDGQPGLLAPRRSATVRSRSRASAAPRSPW